MNLKRSLENLFRGQAVLLTTRSKDDPSMAVPVTADNPLPVTMAGGSVGGGGNTGPAAPTTVLPPQSLSVGASPVSLTVPAGANAATVFVVSGSVRRSIGGTPGAGTPVLNVGDSEEISGGELGAYALVRDGSIDAQVSVEYRVVG